MVNFTPSFIDNFSWYGNFHPPLIITLLLPGLKYQVLSSQNIWLHSWPWRHLKTTPRSRLLLKQKMFLYQKREIADKLFGIFLGLWLRSFFFSSFIGESN